jgi:hypothetical protein
MTYLSNLSPIKPHDLFKGDVVYYADAHAIETDAIHLLQVTKVVSVTSTSVILDNGRKFLLTGEEVTRGSKGVLYDYTQLTRAMVTEAQNKLSLLNDVEGIDFSTLTTQQLSMILDVARGAFTQVTAPSPCGGCGDTVKVAGIDIEVEHELASQNLLAKHPSPDVLAAIAFTDATYELTEAELDDIEDADEDDDYDDAERD